ncbi:MAG: hypothetical protein EOM68_13985 [Spirochaetia bacterium]|nr:hypothetical protein [Spirochaetia bacterium]
MKKATEEVTATATEKVTGTVAGATASVTAEAGKLNGTVASATNGVTQVAEEKKGLLSKVTGKVSDKVDKVSKEELKKNETIAEVSMAYVSENIDALSADLLVGDQQLFTTLEKQYPCIHRIKFEKTTTGLYTSIVRPNHIICGIKDNKELNMLCCFDCKQVGTKLSEMSHDKMNLIQVHMLLGKTSPQILDKRIHEALGVPVEVEECTEPCPVEPAPVTNAPVAPAEPTSKLSADEQAALQALLKKMNG